MGKPSLVRALIYDHSVFHIVPCVADDGDNSIRPRRTQIEVVLQVLGRANQRGLREKQPVYLVVHAVRVAVIGRAHGLLGHLALVHISGALVVVAEWNGRRDDR